MKNDPKISHYIDDEERELAALLEADDFVPESKISKEWLESIQQAAQNTVNEETDKISIRLPKSDLARLKARALREGLPYQTLIKSILHKSVSA